MNITMAIFKLVYLGITIGIAGYMWYLLYYIVKNRNKHVGFDWSKITDVELLDINWTSEQDVVWTKKIKFGPYKIYIGYRKLGEEDSLPIAILRMRKKDLEKMVTKEQMKIIEQSKAKRVGIPLWKKTNFNKHDVTLETIDEVAEGIVDDLLSKINPIVDARLEFIFTTNGWGKKHD